MMTLSKTTIDTRASSSLVVIREYIFREFRYVFRLIGGGGMVLLQNGHVYAKPIDSLSVINQSEGFSDDAL